MRIVQGCCIFFVIVILLTLCGVGGYIYVQHEATRVFEQIVEGLESSGIYIEGVCRG